ncbi:MAG TPA: hypothetical protein VHU80_03140 [Polyangiaceae bacterium]|nr:hypothetical protein [Polyangiaceae bacterium]
MRRILAALPLAIGVAYTLALVVFAYRYSTFVGDDLSAFYLAKTRPFGAYLIGFMGGQMVVLHRLVTYLLYRLSPMNFLPAVLVLGALHLTSAWYLYRTLETMRRSRVNALLVAYYLMSAFVGIQLTWWSSGLHRFGYIACSAIAIHHYVRHAETGKNRDLWLVLFAGILAFGFYAKAVLVPAYCVAVALVSGVDTSGLDRKKRWLRAGTVAALVTLGVAYSLVLLRLMPPVARRLNTDLPYQLLFLQAGFRIFLGSLVDTALVLGAAPPLFFVAVTAAFVCYSSFRSRRALLAWALAVALVAANFLVVGLSSRTLIWRTEMVTEYRYYFELLFFVVLLAGAVFHELSNTPEGRFVARLDPRLTTAAALALLALHGYSSTRTFRYLLRSNRLYATMPASRAFLANLREDLDALSHKGGATPAFIDDGFPIDLDVLDFSFRQYSQLFVVLGADFRFTSVREARYAVGSDGHVVRVRRGRVVRP